jgi:nuclear migration protein JNM1
MAVPSRLAGLPGYDTAPDVYETPELADDTSTAHHTAPSEVEDPTPPTSATTDSENDSESESGVVSRRRLKPSHARERFTREGKGVEIKGGRFGDRVGGLGGRGYRVSQVTRREEESLGERVARLKREVEECRVLAQGADGDGDGAAGEGDMEGLRRVLEGLQTSKGRDPWTRDNGIGGGQADEETSKDVAEFDARLSVLEKSLGLASLDGGAPETPLLPSLALLDRQFGALMNASSLASLEAASARIRKLKEEAEQLYLPAAAPTAQPQINDTSTPNSETTQHGLSPVDIEKLRALHNLLPTLQSLSPTVPALLDRLRSLHTLHAGAANAANELEDLERSQDDLDKELKEWRQGLDRVERAVREADEANGRNGKFVQGWVKEAEARMSKLG